MLSAFIANSGADSGKDREPRCLINVADPLNMTNLDRCNLDRADRRRRWQTDGKMM
jgi:hypothetical protein